jgi:hypothetical protein
VADGSGGFARTPPITADHTSEAGGAAAADTPEYALLMTPGADRHTGTVDKDYWRRESYGRAWALRVRETRQLAGSVSIAIAVIFGIVLLVGLIDLIR